MAENQPAAAAAPTPAPGSVALPVVIGRTERSLGGLLRVALAGSPVAGGDHWVALNVAGQTPADLPGAVAEALGSSDDAARAVIADLQSAGLLETGPLIEAAAAGGPQAGPQVRLAGAGRATLEALRAHVAVRTRPLLADLPPADVASAVRLLDTIRARAIELARTI